jgi:geranylgeranyl pyrophosphate synthase
VSDSFATLNFLNPVQDVLLSVEEQLQAQASDYHPDLDVAVRHLFSSGGKRIRPALALLTGSMLGADQDRLVKLAAAIELLHTATLVHDDLIDGAFLRRGIATLNAQWSPAATVLTGDYIFARAAKLAAETDSVSVMRIFAETLAIIVNGELTQMFSSHGVAERSHYDRRIYAKTASMFELATTAATLLSPVEDNFVDLSRSFGYEIGMAFQIVDDVLDFTGEQETVGKPVASDFRQGLITLPVIYYLEEYPDDPDILAVIDGKYYNDVLIDRVVTSIRMSGAIQRSLEEANRYVDQGVGYLAEMPDCRERQALEELSAYIVRRQN